MTYEQGSRLSSIIADHLKDKVDSSVETNDQFSIDDFLHGLRSILHEIVTI